MIIRKGDCKNKKQNRKRATIFCLIKEILFWFVFLGFWCLAIWIIFFSSAMRVTEIEINASSEQKEKMKEVVAAEMKKDYLGFIPRGNLIIIPKKAIEKKLKEVFVFVKDVQVSKTFPGKIEISVSERESHLVWCSGGSCVLVDENAEAFLLLEKEMEETKDLVRVTDLSNKEISVGSRVANSSFILFCEDLPEKIENQTGIVIDKNLTTPSSMSGEVRTRTKDGWQILFSTSRVAETQGLIIQKILNENIPAEKLEDLEYIDLRIKGKATFRFKGEEKDQGDEDSEEEDGQEE